MDYSILSLNRESSRKPQHFTEKKIDAEVKINSFYATYCNFEHLWSDSANTANIVNDLNSWFKGGNH